MPGGVQEAHPRGQRLVPGDLAGLGEGLEHDREALEGPEEDRVMRLGAQQLHQHRPLDVDVDGIGVGVEPTPGIGDGLRRGDAQQAGNRDRIAHQLAVLVRHGHDVGDSAEAGEQTQQADLPELLGPAHAGVRLDHPVEVVGTADPGMGVGLVDPARVDSDVRGRARRELLVVVGHQRRPAQGTRGGDTAAGVHSAVAGEQSPGIRPLRMDLGDVLGRELAAAAVVGEVQLDVKAELGQACVAEDARGDAVHVEVGGGADLLARAPGVMKGFDHLGQVQEFVVLGGLDLLQVLIRPSSALAQQHEEVDVLVGERVVVDGMKRGHRGGPLDRGRWSVENGA